MKAAEIFKRNALAAGHLHHEFKWNDAELQNEIEILEIVIVYLEARGDCSIILLVLRAELADYNRMQAVRLGKP